MSWSHCLAKIRPKNPTRFGQIMSASRNLVCFSVFSNKMSHFLTKVQSSQPSLLGSHTWSLAFVHIYLSALFPGLCNNSRINNKYKIRVYKHQHDRKCKANEPLAVFKSSFLSRNMLPLETNMQEQKIIFSLITCLLCLITAKGGKIKKKFKN